MEEVLDLGESNPQVSLHALEGTFNFQTMRLKGVVGKRSLCILIDSRSTHNFIDTRVTAMVGCVLESIAKLKVVAANGNELRCREICRGFSWTMQGQQFKANVMTLPLDNYDLVLRVQWLVELGDITWNFEKLNMKFQVGSREYILQREKVPSYSLT